MDKILILDFGSQFTQLIARRIREVNVYCVIYPFDISISFIKEINPKGIILSGSPNSVYDDKKYQSDKNIFKLGIPILGICYGMQWMTQALGGQIKPSSKREFGYSKVYIKDSQLTKGIYDNLDPMYLNVWMSHSDHVTNIPDNFKKIGFSDNCEYAVICNEEKNFYGFQFHPEVTHTSKGKLLLERFVKVICKVKDNWTIVNYIDSSIINIRNLVKNDEEVILGLSGGVDSTVATVLIHKAIKERLTCIFVDNGLLRLDEKEYVFKIFSQDLGIKVIYIDASEQFLKSLKGVEDPEKKRKIIGKEFISVFEHEAVKLKNVKWLAQGTIYPDIIESSNANGNNIKSHHNVGGLPDKLQLKLLEPLKYLFKDEVRKLGFSLGIPKNMILRHPFPGPGLAVRILGEVKLEYVHLLRKADSIFIEELKSNFDVNGITWYDKVSQAFVVFLPIKSVGVMGDGRTYENVVALRAIVSDDFMTANFANLPFSLLSKVSNRIVNEVKGINRVVYDISSKPPSTIEWE